MRTPSKDTTVVASICGPVAAITGGAGGGGGGGAGLLPQKDMVRIVESGVRAGTRPGIVSPRCFRSAAEESQMRPKRSWCKKSRCFRVQWLCCRGAGLYERGRRWAGHGPVRLVSRPELTIQTARLHDGAARKVLTG